MDNKKIIENIMDNLKDPGFEESEATRRAMLRTDLIEAMHMTEGDNVTLPAMQPGELDAFLDVENERAKDG